MLEQWISATAWPMTPPSAYGSFHLLFLFFGLGISAALAYGLRRCSAVCCRRMLLGVGLFLITCEAYKLLFYYYVIGHGSFQWWVFPFQLCSIPMYLCLAANLVRKEHTRSAIYTFLCTYNLLGGFLALLEPSGLSHDYRSHGSAQAPEQTASAFCFAVCDFRMRPPKTLQNVRM